MRCLTSTCWALLPSCAMASVLPFRRRGKRVRCSPIWRSSIVRTRVNVTPRFSLEPNHSINWVDLPGGSFTTRLVGSRVTYTMTPLMFASALLQYNSSNNRVSTNLRLRWEYRPGSELFVVYNEERDTVAPRFPDLQNRALIVKINLLFRF